MADPSSQSAILIAEKTGEVPSVAEPEEDGEDEEDAIVPEKKEKDNETKNIFTFLQYIQPYLNWC